MAVTVTDNRTVVDGADSATGWSSPVAGESITLFTADPDPVELSGCLGIAVSTETSELLFTLGSGVDLSSGTLIYIWILANGTMDNKANGGIQALIGDGTNTIGYHVAGSDLASFRHESGPVGWQCLVIDTSNLPATTTAARGSAGSLLLTALTEFGAQFKTLSKALGGASNCFVDMIRYGNGGLTITTGTSIDPGTFLEIATDDRDNTSGKAYGIIRELGTGLYGLQGALTFGDNSGTTESYFADTNVTVVFEDRSIGTDKYSITVVGNSTGSTTWQLGTKVGTDGGTDGCSLICPTGVGASFDASDADLQFLKIYGSVLSGFDKGVNFSANATNGPNHEVFATKFTGCAQIDPGKIQFKNNEIAASSDANGSILLDSDGTGSWQDLIFTSDGTGHAIYITSTGTYTFNNFKYSNFGADDTTDAAVYNNSGGAVTINITGGGDTPTVRNGAGASTTINNNINVTFSGMKDNTEVRVYDSTTGAEIAGIEDAIDGTTDNRSFTWSDAASNIVDYVIHNKTYETIRVEGYTVPTSDATIPIQQRIDRNYDNPV